jgi:hypothetical protein
VQPKLATLDGKPDAGGELAAIGAMLVHGALTRSMKILPSWTRSIPEAISTSLRAATSGLAKRRSAVRILHFAPSLNALPDS